MIQLCLPVAADSEVHYARGAKVRLRVWRRADGVEMVVEGPPREQNRVRGGPHDGLITPARLKLDVGASAPRPHRILPAWSHRAGFPRDTACDDATFFLAHAEGLIAAYEERSQIRVARRHARATILDGLRHAVTRCEPTLQRHTLAFSVPIRHRVYRWMVEDRSGRLGQLADVCPGALVFAAALAAEPWSAEVADALLEDCVSGLRLGALLERATERWWAAVRAAGQRGQIQRDDAAWSHEMAATPGVEATRRTQRLLVRRAPARLRPPLLLSPPPLAFAPEDIPADERARRRWFHTVKATRAVLVPDPGVAREVQSSLARFVSRNAAAIWDLADGSQCVLRQRLLQLWHYVRAVQRQLARTTNVSRAFSECDAWHEYLAGLELLGAYDLDHLGDALHTGTGPESGGKITAATAFPPSPWGPWKGRRFSVDPITTVGALLREGQEMHHCVFSRVRDVFRGQAFIFSAKTNKARLTIELNWSPNGNLRIQEVAGVMNRPPDEYEQDCLSEWFLAMSTATQG